MATVKLKSKYLRFAALGVVVAAFAAFLLFAISTDDNGTATGQTAPPASPAGIRPGVNASLHGRQIFTPDDAWNTNISKEPADPTSDALIASIGLDRSLHPDFGASYRGGPFGIPYVVVSGKQPRVPVTFDYADQSDPGPYPIPPDAPIEGGAQSDGDRHVVVIDMDNWMLYELEVGVADARVHQADGG